MEGYSNPTTLNGTAGNSAPVGGRRMKLRKVSAKTIRRTLKALRMKPKGRVVLKGGEAPAAEAAAPAAAPPWVVAVAPAAAVAWRTRAVAAARRTARACSPSCSVAAKSSHRSPKPAQTIFR